MVIAVENRRERIVELIADTLDVMGAAVGMQAFKLRYRYPHARPTHSKNTLTCFASLDAFQPCVTKVWVVKSPAVPGPRTTRSATTELAGFRDDTACKTLLVAYTGYGCRRGYCC